MPYNYKKKSRGPSYSSDRSFHSNTVAFDSSSSYPKASNYYQSNMMIPSSGYRSFENGQNFSSNKVPEYQSHSFPLKMPDLNNHCQGYQETFGVNNHFRKHINNMNAKFNSSSLLPGNCPDRGLIPISGESQERSSKKKDSPETGSQTPSLNNAKQSNNDGFHLHPDKLNEIFNDVLGPESVSNKAGSVHNHQNRQNNSIGNSSTNNTGSKNSNNKYFQRNNNKYNRRREGSDFIKYNPFDKDHGLLDKPRDMEPASRDRYQSSRGRGQRPAHYNNSYRPEDDWRNPRHWSQSSKGHQKQVFDSVKDLEKHPRLGSNFLTDKKTVSDAVSEDTIAGNLFVQSQTKISNSSQNDVSSDNEKRINDIVKKAVMKSKFVLPLLPTSVQKDRPPSGSSASGLVSNANRNKESNDHIASASKQDKTFPEPTKESKKSTARSTKSSDANSSNTPAASAKSVGKSKVVTKASGKQSQKSSATKSKETVKKKSDGNSQSLTAASSKELKNSASISTDTSKTGVPDSHSTQPATSSSNNVASNSKPSASQGKRPMTKVELLKLITPRSRKDQQQVERLMKEYNKNKEKIPSTISSPLKASEVEGNFSLDHLDLASLDLKVLKSDIPEELSDTINRVFNLASTAHNPIVLDDEEDVASGRNSATKKKRKESQLSRKRRASDTVGSLLEGKKAKLSHPDVAGVELNESERNEGLCAVDDAVEKDDNVPSSSNNELIDNALSDAGNDNSLSAVSNLLSSSITVSPSENILESLLQISLKEEEIQCNINQLDFDIQHLHACIVEFSQKLTSKKQIREMLLNEEKRLKAIRIQVLKDSISSSSGSSNASAQQLIHHQLLSLGSSSHLQSDNFEVDSRGFFSNNAMPCLDGVINIQPLNDVSDSDVGGAEVIREEPGGSSVNPISLDLSDFDSNSFAPILSPSTCTSDNPSQVRYLGVVNGLSDLLRRSSAKETSSRSGCASAESHVSLQSPIQNRQEIGRKTPASSAPDFEAALL